MPYFLLSSEPWKGVSRAKSESWKLTGWAESLFSSFATNSLQILYLIHMPDICHDTQLGRHFQNWSNVICLWDGVRYYKVRTSPWNLNFRKSHREPVSLCVYISLLLNFSASKYFHKKVNRNAVVESCFWLCDFRVSLLVIKLPHGLVAAHYGIDTD